VRARRKSAAWRFGQSLSLGDPNIDADALEEALLNLSDADFSKVVEPARADGGCILTGDSVADEWERQIWAEEQAAERAASTGALSN